MKEYYNPFKSTEENRIYYDPVKFSQKMKYFHDLFCSRFGSLSEEMKEQIKGYVGVNPTNIDRVIKELEEENLRRRQQKMMLY